MKFYITGSTRGLGEHLAARFNCIRLDRPFYDLATDMEEVCEGIEEGSTVILNAYADGTQIEYVKRLMHSCRLVVCGSIASTYFDPEMPKYSLRKHDLEKFVVEQSVHNKYPMLYLKLTSSSYKDYNMIANTIQFWLDNPNFTFAGYNVNE
jgi:hypothetical protein